MGEQLIGQIASTGIVGVFLVIALLALKKKDEDLQKEKDARITDSEKYMSLAMALQEKVIGAVKSLAEIVEKWEKREEERERFDTPQPRETRPGTTRQGPLR